MKSSQSCSFLEIHDSQVLKESSGTDQPQCGQEWFRKLSVRAAHHQVRPQREISFQLSQGSVSKISMSHTASRGSSQKLQCHRALQHIQKSDHYLIDIASSPKIGFHPPFDLGVFISFPLRDFGFSSPVIVIVKIHFDI